MAKIMKDFLLHFSALFIVVTFGMAFLWPLVRSASDARPPFVSAKAFPELAGLGKDEQKRLLAEATRASFRHWRSFVPFLVFGIFFAIGEAMACTLPKVTTVPDSFWETAITMGVFALLGAWLAGRLSVNHIRPFLKKCIESSGNFSAIFVLALSLSGCASSPRSSVVGANPLAGRWSTGCALSQAGPSVTKVTLKPDGTYKTTLMFGTRKADNATPANANR